LNWKYIVYLKYSELQMYLNYPEIQTYLNYQMKGLNDQILTALHAGGRSEAEMATPTRDPAFPPSTDIATAAPDGTAIKTPTHKLLNIPLFKVHEKVFYL
jgi:hypothetical protein